MTPSSPTKAFASPSRYPRNQKQHSVSLEPYQRFLFKKREVFKVVFGDIGKPVAAIYRCSAPWIFAMYMERPQNNTCSRDLLPIANLEQSQRVNPPILFVT